MKIIIITQNEPFYLAKNLKYFVSLLPDHSKIVGCVVATASPFGKQESFIKKAKKTYDVFGFEFFIHYSIKFLKSRIDRNTKVCRVLKDNGIPIITLDSPINDKKSVDRIKYFQPDLLVSILGNQIFKAPILNLAPKGCINLHTALLPKYRGLMPTFWAMRNNEKYTGVSVFFVDEGIDSGPIIVQEKFEIGILTQEQLINRTKKIGMELIAKSIDLIHKDEVELMENNTEEKTYYTFPTKRDVLGFKEMGKKFF
jgi:methionyl-tRNA formyltransferase